ncbi:MAG: sulfate permease [Candidatus Schekmanbacteria bacterium]|nr:sulfate permease [Candidatus Schekmanbacteria bacterium]
MQIKGYDFNRRELSGALADLGTFLPLALALIALNGVDAGAVFLSAGLLYIAAGWYFKLPIPVQPLKATSAIAIAIGATHSMLTATALCMAVFLLLAASFDLDKIIRWFFPLAIVRGIQLSLGFLMIKTGIALIMDRRFLSGGAQMVFSLGGFTLPVGIPAAIIGLALILLLRNNPRFPAALLVIAAGLIIGVSVSKVNPESLHLGWTVPVFKLPSLSDFTTALTVLFLPQLPLTLANSVAATADASRQYFGSQAEKVTHRALAGSLGIANLVVGLIGGIPLCHGAGGLTAHYRFGARSGGAGLIIGGIFVAAALLLGRSASTIFALLPLGILGLLLVCNGVAHLLLLKDIVRQPARFALATGMGVLSFLGSSPAPALMFGVIVSWLGKILVAFSTGDP